MTLPSGTKLGPYEIVAPIGAGGMGDACICSGGLQAGGFFILSDKPPPSSGLYKGYVYIGHSV